MFSSISKLEFSNSLEINFDLAIHDLKYVFQHISQNPNSYFTFNIVNGEHQAFGPGADCQIYQKLCADLFAEKIVFEYNDFFMDINENHDFWSSDINVGCFVTLIASIINSECIMSHHLSPRLLEIITGRTLELSDLEFYMSKVDPETLFYAKKCNNLEFANLNLDYASHNDLYRDKICYPASEKKLVIYFLMSEYLKKLSEYTILTIDYFFSGEYCINHEHVLDATIILDPLYSELWREFIYSLNESELRNLLLTFGNTLSLEKKYNIHVDDGQDDQDDGADIHISTCSNIIIISKKFFESTSSLAILKSCFSKYDQYISDNIIHNSDSDTDSDTDSDDPRFYDSSTMSLRLTDNENDMRFEN